MTRDEARADILTRLKEYVEMTCKKAKSDGKYCCPVCGSGDHRNGTSAFKYDKDGEHPRWECYAHTNGNATNKAVGDIFDLIGEAEGIQDREAQFQRALQIFRITIDDKPTRPRPAPAKKPAQRKEAADLTDYFARCAANNAPALDYLAKRGIPAEIANRHGVGYDAELGFKQGEKGNIKAVIFPTGSSTFVARNMDENATIRYINLAGQHVTLWNTEALQTEGRPVFIVEGIIDAMSIEAVGGAAVALNGAANGGLLLDAVKENTPKALLIVALDNETEANKKQTIDGNAERLEKELKALGIRCARGNPAGTYKDANEALCASREKFAEAVAEAVAEAEAAANRDADEENQKTAADYDSRYSAGEYVQEFFKEVRDSVNTPALSTGFFQLDECLGGGLYEGLYALGGASGTGKTALIMQIADNIAAAGHDVLVFALEMSKAQLMARSISRHTYVLAGKKYRGTQRDDMAKSNIGITNFSKWVDYSAEEQNIIYAAATEYGKYAKHVYIREGIGTIGAAEIREQVEQHVKITGRTPVVMIDYLQILAPADVRGTDKQNTDKAVLGLKQLSRDYKTPVIAVSSFNRASYSTAATEAAYRESSSIEYTSDVLFALQFSKIGTQGFDAEEEKGKASRNMQLSIIKNRYGEPGKKIGFNYKAKFNYFGEAEENK